MLTLTDTIEIKASAETIFQWLIQLDKNYRSWHPDHGKCYWLKGNSFEKGSILYVEEHLHGELHKMKFQTTNIIPNSKIEFKILFPMSIVCPKGSFVIEPKGDVCIFTAKLYIRFASLFSKLASSRVEAFKLHMKEEGENLKRLLESK